MSVEAWVITLSGDPEERAQALRWLGEDARVTLGPMQGAKLPVVTECGSVEEAEDWERGCHHEAGICGVSLVFVDFSDIEGEVDIRRRSRRRRFVDLKEGGR